MPVGSNFRAMCLLVFLPLIAGQTEVDSTTTGVGILQMITPTRQASEVPITALETLSADAADFYTSYTQIDSFDFIAQQVTALKASPSLIGANGKLDQLYIDALVSLLDQPSSYMSRLHATLASWPQDYSSSIVSQASGLLLGYESIATKDVLSSKPTQGPITPGMSIDVGPGPTGGAGGTAAAPAATGPSSSSSKAAAPAPTADLKVVANAIAGAAGLAVVALL